MTAALTHERIACLYCSDANGFWQILLDENTSDATCGTVPLLHILDNQVNICLYEYMLWNKVKAVFMNKCKHLKLDGRNDRFSLLFWVCLQLFLTARLYAQAQSIQKHPFIHNTSGFSVLSQFGTKDYHHHQNRMCTNLLCQLFGVHFK